MQAQGCICFGNGKGAWLAHSGLQEGMSEAMAMSLSVSGYSPSYLTALFQPAASNHLHRKKSASSGGICLPQVKTEIGKKYFVLHSAARRWNALPLGLGLDRATAICSHLLTYVLRLLLLTSCMMYPNWYNYVYN